MGPVTPFLFPISPFRNGNVYPVPVLPLLFIHTVLGSFCIFKVLVQKKGSENCDMGFISLLWELSQNVLVSILGKGCAQVLLVWYNGEPGMREGAVRWVIHY